MHLTPVSFKENVNVQSAQPTLNLNQFEDPFLPMQNMMMMMVVVVVVVVMMTIIEKNCQFSNQNCLEGCDKRKSAVENQK